MTTTVIVKAHCTNDKEVVVEIKGSYNGLSDAVFTLQDTQTLEQVVFDDREITVKEVMKTIEGEK